MGKIAFFYNLGYQMVKEAKEDRDFIERHPVLTSLGLMGAGTGLGAGIGHIVGPSISRRGDVTLPVESLIGEALIEGTGKIKGPPELEEHAFNIAKDILKVKREGNIVPMPQAESTIRTVVRKGLGNMAKPIFLSDIEGAVADYVKKMSPEAAKRLISHESVTPFLRSRGRTWGGLAGLFLGTPLLAIGLESLRERKRSKSIAEKIKENLGL